MATICLPHTLRLRSRSGKEKKRNPRYVYHAISRIIRYFDVSVIRFVISLLHAPLKMPSGKILKGQIPRSSIYK